MTLRLRNGTDFGRRWTSHRGQTLEQTLDSVTI
jgi:hypothetical protein